MRIPRSTFYYQDKEKPFRQLKAEADLRDEIEKICLNNPKGRVPRACPWVNV